MLFNSLDYLIFLPTVFIIYWIFHKKNQAQNVLLLVSSYVFYAWWDWRFLSLIIFSSCVDYIVGKKIFATDKDSQRRNWLLLSLAANLGLLITFKYFNFFTESFATSMSLLGWEVDPITLKLILPVGISFYTFQTLSYTIDIYRKQLKPSKDLVAFFTYVSFFPQLVAGPIERASNLLPQIENKRTFRFIQFKEGLFQISIGFFRKIVIADNLGVYVDLVYGNPEIHHSLTLIIATVFYAFQIYYDFAGYSDIAIGSAKLFGFSFNQNFDLPYFSKSLTIFWRKWHKSLSFWLRDYLYISLGGNRKGNLITYRNLMLTMLLGGLWHGSSWNFIIWGGIHGIGLAIERLFFSRSKRKNLGVLGYLSTFSIVLFAWIFFRAADLDSAFQIIQNIVRFDLSIPFMEDFYKLAIILFIGFCFDLFIYRIKKPLESLGGEIKTVPLAFILAVIIILISLLYSTSENFIYFQF